VADVTSAVWCKSSYSGNGGQQNGCVEVARNLPGIVATRDSKDPHGPVLTVSADGWTRFVSSLRRQAGR
jgi:hypothetical protein